MTSPLIMRRPEELSAREMHDLLKLRVDVFVVEQDCPYPDIDGQDVLPDTVHICAYDGETLLATLRVLGADGAEPAIGRVATRRRARGRGLAGALLEQGIALCRSDARIHLGAQAHLEQWYARFGFLRAGEEYDEDGIPHVPMIRAPRG